MLIDSGTTAPDLQNADPERTCKTSSRTRFIKWTAALCLGVLTFAGLMSASTAVMSARKSHRNASAASVYVSPKPTYVDQDPESVVSADRGRYNILSPSSLAEYKSLQSALTRADWPAFERQLGALSDSRLAASFAGLQLLHPSYTPTSTALISWLRDNKINPLAPAVLSRAQTILSPADRKQLTAPVAVAALSGGDSEADGRSSTRDAAGPLVTAVMKFFDGDDNAAREATVDNDAPLALWTAGLAAWRQNDIPAARAAFTRMAQLSDIHKWDRASAAFWAGRAALTQGDKTEANRLFRSAADLAPRSFYGLLAAQQLGIKPKFDWRMPQLAAMDLKEIRSTASGDRALMWLELGDRTLAEGELRQAVRSATASQRRAIMLLADAERLPNLSYGLSLYARGKYADLRLPALYPVPAWQPAQGFSTSPALVYALMRQESAFNPLAHSRSGAQGAMQLMPDTAARFAQNAEERHRISTNLTQPEVSIEVAERYLKSMATAPQVRGNLLKLIASYNCGTGNLQRWLSDLPANNDPLLFVESLPARETRDFVETVMASFWMYQLRLEEEPTSLAALADGRWPQFSQGDISTVASAR